MTLHQSLVGFNVRKACARNVRRAAAIALLACAVPGSLLAQSVPDGFSVQLVVGEPFGAATVAFVRLPDGRILINELSTGVIRLAAVGASSSVAIHTVPNVEGIHPERGLLGIAVDPDWPLRPYIYCLYNHTGGTQFITMFEGGGELTNPLSTALTLTNPFHLFTDLPDVNGIHNGGTLRFGPDDMLYASLGEDGQACQAQELASPLGSILRLDVSAMPGSGSGPPPKADITPPDNPFPGPNEWARLRYAWGLRNPYRFTIDPVSGALTIGDVGSSFFEEIDRLEIPEDAGANFGWPQREGTQQIFCCGDCGQENTFTNAVHLFPHLPTVTSIIGGPVVRTNVGSQQSFPASYEGDVFYFEFFSGVMRRLTQNANETWSIAPPEPGQDDLTSWGTGIFGVTDAQMAPDGAMDLAVYGVAGTPRGIYRVTRVPAIGAPEIESLAGDFGEIQATPNPARAGEVVMFTLTRSTRDMQPVSHFTVEDVRGRRVRSLPCEDAASDPQTRWDLRDESGRLVSPGVYFVSALGAQRSFAAGRVTILR